MRHQCRVHQLGRPADQRKAMLRGLTTQLIREGRVTTTKARAKALREEADRMITLAKDGSLASRRRAIGAKDSAFFNLPSGAAKQCFSSGNW